MFQVWFLYVKDLFSVDSHRVTAENMFHSGKTMLPRSLDLGLRFAPGFILLSLLVVLLKCLLLVRL